MEGAPLQKHGAGPTQSFNAVKMLKPKTGLVFDFDVDCDLNILTA